VSSAPSFDALDSSDLFADVLTPGAFQPVRAKDEGSEFTFDTDEPPSELGAAPLVLRDAMSQMRVERHLITAGQVARDVPPVLPPKVAPRPSSRAADALIRSFMNETTPRPQPVAAPTARATVKEKRQARLAKERRMFAAADRRRWSERVALVLLGAAAGFAAAQYIVL
jgi:hypothetical protein